MGKRRRRVKQTLSLGERLLDFASDARKTAQHLPAGSRRTELLDKARHAEMAARIERLLMAGSSNGEEQLRSGKTR